MYIYTHLQGLRLQFLLSSDCTWYPLQKLCVSRWYQLAVALSNQGSR